MKLPISFANVSYLDDEYRGDLIVTDGAVYFFPTKRSGVHRLYLFGGVPDRIANFTLKFCFMFFSGVGVGDLIEFLTTFGSFAKRNTSTNRSRELEKLGIWSSGLTNEELQAKIEHHILRISKTKTNFLPGSLPKPFGFRRTEVKNIAFKWKFRFDSEFEPHDFGISPFFRSRLKQALGRAGFLPKMVM